MLEIKSHSKASIHFLHSEIKQESAKILQIENRISNIKQSNINREAQLSLFSRALAEFSKISADFDTHLLTNYFKHTKLIRHLESKFSVENKQSLRVLSQALDELKKARVKKVSIMNLAERWQQSESTLIASKINQLEELEQVEQHSLFRRRVH